jgi:hypothetical protein
VEKLYKYKRYRKLVKAKYYLPIVGSIIALLVSFLSNELNVSNIKNENASMLRNGITVSTADDVSYIAPAINLVENGILKNNDTGIHSYYERPPGYSVFIAIFYYFDNCNWQFLVKYSQLFLFATASFLIYMIVFVASCNVKLSFVAQLIFGLSPIFYGFIYYTISEAITPQLVIVFLYFIILYKKSSKLIFLIFSGIILSIIFSIRPVLVFLAIIPILLILYRYKFSIKTFATILLISTISFSSIIIWGVRNYSISSKIVSLHPIYEPSQNSVFRPTHRALWNFVKLWGEDGAKFHSYIVPFWENNIDGRYNENEIQIIINSFPHWVIESVGKHNLTNTFQKYAQSIIYQREYYALSLAMPNDIPEIEKDVIKDFENYANIIKIKQPLKCFVVTPLLVFKKIAFHSNLSLYMFQNTYRGNFLVETLRVVYYIFHALMFLNVFFSVLYFRKNSLVFSISTSIILYLLLLMYVQIGVEERYTMPVLPLLYFLFINLFIGNKVK